MLALALGILTLIDYWLRSTYAPGRSGPLTLLESIFILGIGVALWWDRRRRRRKPGDLNPHFDLEARIQVYGNADELRPLVELPDVSFEPIIVSRL